MKLSLLLCSILSAVALLHPAPKANAEALWTIDWSEGEVDKPVTKETNPHFTTSKYDADHRVILVGRSSPLPNPFPDIEKALLIERGESANVPVLRWSLGQGGRQKGSFEVQFVMLGGDNPKGKALRFYIGSVQERNGKPYLPNAGHVRVMSGGVAFLAEGETNFRSSKVKPVEGINTLKIGWDVLDKRGFWATLNGQPVRVNGETTDGPSMIPIPAELCTAIGNVTLMMQYPQTKAFIGKIIAE